MTHNPVCTSLHRRLVDTSPWETAAAGGGGNEEAGGREGGGGMSVAGCMGELATVAVELEVAVVGGDDALVWLLSGISVKKARRVVVLSPE